ncbi:MAG: hypothetical protein HZY75_06660 [Nocardioidaceae bacterium]|nr:MAG: hypothetical protein HZY75_06660 [Nocardioidaceae bacterium]
MARSTRTIFLDANVLAAPVTRTLLLVGIEAVDVIATWSQNAEDEANRHMRPRAMSVTEFRTTIWENDLSPTGKRPSKYKATKDADRQILADAVAANAAFIITTDVDDFGEADLVTEKIAAVNPDLFMATRFTETAYRRALTQLVESLNNPPKTIAQMHALIGRKHPRLHEWFAHRYPEAVPEAMETEPRVLYRGGRCIICARSVTRPERLTLGCHPACLTTA